MMKMLAASFQQMTQVTQSLILMQDSMITLCKTNDINDSDGKIKLE